jgi:hypothetical protein
MLEDKAESLPIHEDLDIIDKLYCLLGRYRIPKDQFYKVEEEIGDV